jgi:hypothetical protein
LYEELNREAIQIGRVNDVGKVAVDKEFPRQMISAEAAKQ